MYDLEWRFMPSLNLKNIFIYDPEKCLKDQYYDLPKFKQMTFVWYSKRETLNSTDPELVKFINKNVIPY